MARKSSPGGARKSSGSSGRSAPSISLNFSGDSGGYYGESSLSFGQMVILLLLILAVILAFTYFSGGFSSQTSEVVYHTADYELEVGEFWDVVPPGVDFNSLPEYDYSEFDSNCYTDCVVFSTLYEYPEHGEVTLSGDWLPANDGTGDYIFHPYEMLYID